MSNRFLSEYTGGLPFLDWVDDFISGEIIPASEKCTSCGAPVPAIGRKLYPH